MWGTPASQISLWSVTESLPLKPYTCENDSVADVNSLLCVRRGGRRFGIVWDIWELANVLQNREGVLGINVSGCVNCLHNGWVNCFTRSCCQWTSKSLGQLAFSEEIVNVCRLSSVLENNGRDPINTHIIIFTSYV